MSNQDIALMGHLMRRAGFGANRDELEECVDKGYEAVVEDLLYPGDPQNLPDDIIRRYHTEQAEMRLSDGAAAYWLYRMITPRCPLEDQLGLLDELELLVLLALFVFWATAQRFQVQLSSFQHASQSWSTRP